ncbi:MAG: AGE family epimerase/isomerase [Opitutaceae bacterium]|jgi:mannose/cellobiose epimerase-like protein (N-acyl-D-glucosamine 2-epimerase family)|nr:AGE family epimerase/isomerase [Opitutaceae bacterium]
MIISGRSGPSPLLILRLVALGLAAILPAAASVSDAASLWLQRWSAHLDRDVLPFWLTENERPPSPDNPDADMRSRFLSLQLRSLHVLAAAISRETDPDACRHLRSRLARRQASLVARFRDTRSGDWFSTEDAGTSARDGDSPPPVPKNTADQAWAMLLLADIHELAGVPDALRLARETFARIDPLAHDDRRVWWWPQAETAAALWRLYRITGHNVWLARFEQVSAWAFAHLVPPENPGRWHTLCTADGPPLPHAAVAAHEIQTGFHVVRSLLAIGKN